MIEAEIQALASVLSFRVSGRATEWGPGAAVSTGASGEFERYLPYEPGTDVRRVDARVYDRLGQYVVRVSREEAGRRLLAWIDRSASMNTGDKRRSAVEWVSLLSQLSAQTSNPLGVILFPDLAILEASSLQPLCLSELDALLFPRDIPTRELGLGHAAREVDRSRRDLLVGLGRSIVMSDMWGVHSLSAELEDLTRLAPATLLWCLEREEREPELSNAVTALELRSRESEPTVVIANDNDLPHRYFELLKAYQTELEGYFRRERGEVIELDAGKSIFEQAELVLSGGSFLSR